MATRSKRRNRRSQRKVRLNSKRAILFVSFLFIFAVTVLAVVLYTAQIDTKLKPLQRLESISLNCPKERLATHPAVFNGKWIPIEGLTFDGTTVSVFFYGSQPYYHFGPAFDCLVALITELDPSQQLTINILIGDDLPPEAPSNGVAFTGRRHDLQSEMEVIVDANEVIAEAEAFGENTDNLLDNTVIHETLVHAALQTKSEVSAYAVGESYQCLLENGSDYPKLQPCLNSRAVAYDLSAIREEIIFKKLFRVSPRVWELFKKIKERGHFFSTN